MGGYWRADSRDGEAPGGTAQRAAPSLPSSIPCEPVGRVADAEVRAQGSKLLEAHLDHLADFLNVSQPHDDGLLRRRDIPFIVACPVRRPA